MMRDVDQAGIDLIKRFEGCRLIAYRCPAGVVTIGYGWTRPLMLTKLAENLCLF